jgi:hypothetical protein
LPSLFSCYSAYLVVVTAVVVFAVFFFVAAVLVTAILVATVLVFLVLFVFHNLFSPFYEKLRLKRGFVIP